MAMFKKKKVFHSILQQGNRVLDTYLVSNDALKSQGYNGYNRCTITTAVFAVQPLIGGSG